jgi:hypothetical protein
MLILSKGSIDWWALSLQAFFKIPVLIGLGAVRVKNHVFKGWNAYIHGQILTGPIVNPYSIVRMRARAGVKNLVVKVWNAYTFQGKF